MTNTIKSSQVNMSSRIEKRLKIKEQVHPFNPKDPSSKTVTDKFAMLQGRYSPILGEAIDKNGENLELDQLEIDCRLEFMPFDIKQLPSVREGFCFDSVNWAKDYEALVKAAPLEIFPYEEITGKLHWRLYTYRERKYKNLERIRQLRKKAWEHGAGALVWNRTSPELSFGLENGWGRIKEKVIKKQLQFEREGKEKEAKYLKAVEIVCNTIISKIKEYSKAAKRLALSEIDEDRKERYVRISKVCSNISREAPATFQEAVQWLHFFIMFNKVIGECDGPIGRIDQLLLPFYKKDIENGIVTREEARDMIADLFIHLDPWLTIGGRSKEMKDATNEVSWLILEAYDSLQGYPGNFAVMWHKDIDNEFFRYACDILVRYRNGAPILVNYDVMRESLIHQGIKEEDAWNVCHNGCGWYSIPGKQYLCGDWCSINLLICFMNVLEKSISTDVQTFDQFFDLYSREVKTAAKILNELVDTYLAEAPDIWPEIVISSCTPDCIEKGKDVSNGGVPYYNATVQTIGLANAVDSLYAIKQLVFEEKKLSLKEIKEILKKDYEGYEDIYQLILNIPKYGNDNDQVDGLASKVVDQLCETLVKQKNSRNGSYYPLLWSHVGHIYIGKELGATPDGRKAGQPLAQGGNPANGMAKEGLTAHARSMAKLNFRRLNGGTLQIEMNPSVLKIENPSAHLANIIKSYFDIGGQQVQVNIHTVEELEEAIKIPEKYQNLIVRVTGFSARFVGLREEIQKEIIAREHYNNITIP